MQQEVVEIHRFESIDHFFAGAAAIRNFEEFRIWIDTSLRPILSHQALYCGQAITHSGGYAAIRSWHMGVPDSYVAAVSRPVHNVRSPIYEKLLQSKESLLFFDAERDGVGIDSVWLNQFKIAGWHRVLLFQYSEGSGDSLLLSTAAFYNVQSEIEPMAQHLQQLLMPLVHSVLSRLYRAEKPKQRSRPKLTHAEDAIASLLRHGKTNKEIAKLLDKSDHTVKHQLTSLMRKLNVKNRIALVQALALV